MDTITRALADDGVMRGGRVERQGGDYEARIRRSDDAAKTFAIERDGLFVSRMRAVVAFPIACAAFDRGVRFASQVAVDPVDHAGGKIAFNGQGRSSGQRILRQQRRRTGKCEKETDGRHMGQKRNFKPS